MYLRIPAIWHAGCGNHSRCLRLQRHGALTLVKDQKEGILAEIIVMSIKEILEELPKLTKEEKRQLWNVLNHEVTHDVEGETPELLAAIDESIRSLESGEKTYTIEEARRVVAETVAKARR